MAEDIIVTLKRSNDLLMTFGNDYSDVFLPAIDEIERLREALAEITNIVNPQYYGAEMQKIAQDALEKE
jgi:hypothetical protein